MQQLDGSATEKIRRVEVRDTHVQQLDHAMPRCTAVRASHQPVYGTHDATGQAASLAVAVAPSEGESIIDEFLRGVGGAKVGVVEMVLRRDTAQAFQGQTLACSAADAALQEAAGGGGDRAGRPPCGFPAGLELGEQRAAAEHFYIGDDVATTSAVQDPPVALGVDPVDEYAVQQLNTDGTLAVRTAGSVDGSEHAEQLKESDVAELEAPVDGKKSSTTEGLDVDVFADVPATTDFRVACVDAQQLKEFDVAEPKTPSGKKSSTQEGLDVDVVEEVQQSSEFDVKEPLSFMTEGPDVIEEVQQSNEFDVKEPLSTMIEGPDVIEVVQQSNEFDVKEPLSFTTEGPDVIVEAQHSNMRTKKKNAKRRATAK